MKTIRLHAGAVLELEKSETAEDLLCVNPAIKPPAMVISTQSRSRTSLPGVDASGDDQTSGESPYWRCKHVVRATQTSFHFVGKGAYIRQFPHRLVIAWHRMDLKSTFGNITPT
jgi:hypothetical protein